MPLIGWWKLDGDAYDSSPSKNNGANTGVTFNSSYGIIGQGGNFDGTASYIDIPQIDITTHHTICFWMHGNTSAPSPPDDSVILGQNGTSNNYIAVVDSWGIAFDDGAGFGSWETDKDFYNKWRHITLVFNSSTIDLYLDGVLSVDASPSYDGTFTFDNIGEAETTASYYYNGYLNDIRVYDHKLSKKEIQEIARAKVLHWQFSQEKNTSGDLILDSSGFERHATLNSSKPLWGPFPPPSGIGSYDWASGSNDYIQINSTDFPVNFGDAISISYWVYPDTITSWDTMVHGNLTASWSSSYWLAMYLNGSIPAMRFSINGTSMNFDTGMVADNWYHVFATYDGANMNAFINGVDKGTNAIKTGAITNDTGVKLGLDGTAQPYNLDGKLADFRIYNRGYDATDGQAEALRLYQTSASLDTNGNLHTRILSEGGQEDKTLCNYDVWTEGTGSITGWIRMGLDAENDRAYGLDPWGRSTIIWECIAGADTSYDGGWNQSPAVAIDNTKTYRFSTWVRRTVLGTSGRFYLGFNGYGTVNGVLKLTDAESLTPKNTNPYFWSTSTTPNTSELPDEWILVVGHCFPTGTAQGTPDHPDSGRYHPSTGEQKITGGNYNFDFRWIPETTTTRHRSFLYGGTDLSVRQLLCYPRIDLVDGTEPTIADLLSGNYYDPNYANDITNIGTNGTVVSTNFSEVGITDGMVGYWPLNGNTLDYSGNENTGTASGATVVGGLAPRDKDCYEFLTTTDKIELDNDITLTAGTEWSWSFWGYHTATYANHGIGGNGTSTANGRLSFNNSTQLTMYTTGSSNPTISVSAFPTNAWFHFVVTHTSGNVVTVYRDGVSVGTGSLSPTGNIIFNRIGDNPDNSSWTAFGGHMFDFRIYNNKLLTPQEIDILSKTFDTDSIPRTEMKDGGDGLYTFGEFQEGL